ncbi:hypothetical protein N7449_007524 [Penicillium cf. viridicatum]|uniref:Uncharacterized protein n=1 Tax=Penicillium cf. viridicatum TaxID=2972119 RepID=A0A9W9JHG5_9EURO|nr:hypothetical protein N7449_007524 [Penicillium cf. viridicatum]
MVPSGLSKCKGCRDDDTGEAPTLGLDTVVYLKLRALASILQKKTPFEILYGKPPSLLHLRRIGSRAWVLIPKEHRAKLGPRSSECRLLANGLTTPPASPLPSTEREKPPSQRAEETLPPVNPIEQEAESTQDLGYSIYARRRRPSRRLLKSLGKVYTAGALNTASARTVNPSTFHEAVSGPNQLEWWAAIQKEYASLLEHGTLPEANSVD